MTKPKSRWQTVLSTDTLDAAAAGLARLSAQNAAQIERLREQRIEDAVRAGREFDLARMPDLIASRYRIKPASRKIAGVAFECAPYAVQMEVSQ